MGSFLSGFLSPLFAIAFILLPSLSVNLAGPEATDLRGGKRLSIISQDDVYAMIYPSPSPTPILTSSLTPSLRPSPSPQPKTQEVYVASHVSNDSNLLSQINSFRQSNGLAPVSENNETCSFADIRASEISLSFNHDGFRTRIDNKTLPYPTYSQVTENIAMNSNPSEVVNSWINSAPHAENMKKDTPFVCIFQNGNYFAYEGWKP